MFSGHLQKVLEARGEEVRSIRWGRRRMSGVSGGEEEEVRYIRRRSRVRSNICQIVQWYSGVNTTC